MKRIKDFFNNHLVLIVILFSILYAIIVHFCFKIKCFPYFLTAEWSAGDILTYVSTLSLGVIALWQNKMLREENEKSQKRLEEINNRANELRVVQKIIEIESKKLERVRNALDDFDESCNPQNIDIALNKAGGSALILREKLGELKRNMTNAFNSMGRELRNDSKLKNNDDAPIKKQPVMLLQQTENTIQKLYDNLSYDAEKDLVVMAEIRKDFRIIKEEYLCEQEKKLNAILYEDKSLDEIKEMYR